MLIKTEKKRMLAVVLLIFLIPVTFLAFFPVYFIMICPLYPMAWISIGVRIFWPVACIIWLVIVAIILPMMREYEKHGDSSVRGDVNLKNYRKSNIYDEKDSEQATLSLWEKDFSEIEVSAQISCEQYESIDDVNTQNRDKITEMCTLIGNEGSTLENSDRSDINEQNEIVVIHESLHNDSMSSSDPDLQHKEQYSYEEVMESRLSNNNENNSSTDQFNDKDTKYIQYNDDISLENSDRQGINLEIVVIHESLHSDSMCSSDLGLQHSEEYSCADTSESRISNNNENNLSAKQSIEEDSNTHEMNVIDNRDDGVLADTENAIEKPFPILIRKDTDQNIYECSLPTPMFASSVKNNVFIFIASDDK